MGRIVVGVVATLGAVFYFLYGLGYPSNSHEPWLFAKIPAVWAFGFLGLAIPRVFILGIAVLWFGGALQLIGKSVSDAMTVRTFATALKSGKEAAQVLQEVVQSSLVNEARKLAAQAVIRGEPYATSIMDISHHTGKSIDEVVLNYKLAVDHLLSQTALIRQAAVQVGKHITLPDFSFPAVLVTKSQPRGVAELFTKVDFSSTGNTTPLLTEGDLIYSYDGELLWQADQLDQLASAGTGREKVPVGVLRHVRTTNFHPIMAMPDEYVWQTFRFDISGGPINATYS